MSEKRAKILAALREFDHAPDRMLDVQICEALGVSQVTLCRMRKEMGYRKVPAFKGFPSKLTPEVREWVHAHWPVSPLTLSERWKVSTGTAEKWLAKMNMQPGHKGKWGRFPHPKGFTGLIQSPAGLQRIAEASRRAWRNPNSVLNSPAERKRRSEQSTRLQLARRWLPRYSRGNAGRRADLENRYFRSTWEANYARYLNFLKAQGKLYAWEYEAETFFFDGIKRGCRFYTPDFKIWDTPEATPYFVEVKGWMDQKSKTKLARMKRYHPHVRVDLVTAKEYRAIKEYSRLLPGWETSKGPAR